MIDGRADPHARGCRDGCGDRGPIATSVISYREGGIPTPVCGVVGIGDRGESIRRRARGLRRRDGD